MANAYIKYLHMKWPIHTDPKFLVNKHMHTQYSQSVNTVMLGKDAVTYCRDTQAYFAQSYLKKHSPIF